MRKIKVAQIGIDHGHAAEVLTSLKKQSDIFDLVGYALPAGEKSKYSSKLLGFDDLKELSVDEIMNDPSVEAVIIETEVAVLSKFAFMAAKHGKHIQMDKPGGMDLQEFEELIKTVKEKISFFIPVICTVITRKSSNS